MEPSSERQVSYEPATHYDRVTAAWGLLLGEELHYGAFADAGDDLASATRRLTALMLESARIEPDMKVLDVGCGTGAPACRIAAELRARVIGISTSPEGIQLARDRAVAAELDHLVSFEVRDGMDNGFHSRSFDRVWVLESSHLMRHRDQLFSECARVLRPGGRMTLCDIVLRRPLDLNEVRRLRGPLTLLRAVFGDARMEPLMEYVRLADANALSVDQRVDLTAATRPTFARWRENADRYRSEVVALIGAEDWQRFRDSCEVLERFWDDGTLGYALLSANKTS